MKTVEEKKLKIMFNAGKRCMKAHPDDDTYDDVYFKRAMKKALKIQSLCPTLPSEEEMEKAANEHVKNLNKELKSAGFIEMKRGMKINSTIDFRAGVNWLLSTLKNKDNENMAS